MPSNYNIRTNDPTKVPALPKLPASIAPELRRYLETLEQVTDIRLGRRGDPRDRAVTLRELISSGLAQELAASPYNPNAGQSGFVPAGATLPDLSVPPAPTGFTVTGAFSIINMSWNLAAYANHSHTEIHSHTADVIGDAVLLGIAPSRVFSDPVGSGQTRYYWVRHVNTEGVAGPFNSASGTIGQTAADVDHLLSLLTNAVTESQLANALTTKLDGFESDIDDLETTFGSTSSAATSAAAAAASESAAIAAKTAALLAQTGAETARDSAVVAKTSAETAKAGAETAQTSASSSATGAAGSASNAASSATAAANSATAAGNSATAASTSESNASTFATNAGTAATASQTAKVAAETASTNAANSASAASTSASNASASESAAGTSASAADTAKTAAQTAQSNAETAETNAATSETNAAGSASSASTSATNAANSATAAGNSASAANTSASTASTEATNAGASATAAAASQTAASTSESNAAASASAASTSATNASASETAAGSSASTASGHANTASTKAGEAATSASNAASSESNAAGSATAAASTVNGLTARLNDVNDTGSGGAVTVEEAYAATATNIDDITHLEGQFTVKVDINGAVAGFGLASTGTSQGNITSEFIVNADRFAIMRGGSNTTAASVPFIVQASGTTLNGETVPAGVYMQDAFIKNGSIVSAKIGSLAVDKITGTFAQFQSVLTGNLDANRINIDGTTLTSTTINGVPTLTVNAITANKITSGTLDAGNITVTNLSADSIVGDINVFQAVNSTNSVTLTNANQYYEILDVTLPAPDISHLPIASVVMQATKSSSGGTEVGMKITMQGSGSSTSVLGTITARSSSSSFGFTFYTMTISGNHTSTVTSGATIFNTNSTSQTGTVIGTSYSNAATTITYSGATFFAVGNSISVSSSSSSEVIVFEGGQDHNFSNGQISQAAAGSFSQAVTTSIRVRVYAKKEGKTVVVNKVQGFLGGIR